MDDVFRLDVTLGGDCDWAYRENVVKVKVRLAGIIRTMCQWDERELVLDTGSCLDDLKRKLEKEYPAICFERISASASVNQNLADDSIELQDGDEISFLPPLAGG